MRNLAITYLLLAISQFISAQSFEMFAGINSNHPYETVNEKSKPISATFQAAQSYSVGFSVGNLKLKGIIKRITLSHNKVNGYIGTTSFYFTSSTDVQIDKHTVNLTLYPLVTTLKNIHFSLGVQGNLMISRFSRGYAGLLGTEPPPDYLNIELSAPNFHKALGYGIAARTHYNIEFRNGISIVPQYNLYLGIGEEYSTAEYEKIRVWQQVLALGISKQF